MEDYAAPVLLIYSQSDEIVPAYQSERMRRALKEAGKDVELLKIDGDDHHLSFGETRPQALKTTAFIRRAAIGRWRFVQDRRTTPKPRTRNPGLRRSPTVSSNGSQIYTHTLPNQECGYLLHAEFHYYELRYRSRP